MDITRKLDSFLGKNGRKARFVSEAAALKFDDDSGTPCYKWTKGKNTFCVQASDDEVTIGRLSIDDPRDFADDPDEYTDDDVEEFLENMSASEVKSNSAEIGQAIGLLLKRGLIKWGKNTMWVGNISI